MTNPEENKLLPTELDPPLALEVRVGDVLMSRASGSAQLIGSVAVVPERCRPRLLLSDKTYRLRVDRRLADPAFVAFGLGSAVGRLQIQQVVSGAPGLAKNIAQSDVKEFVLPVPPLPEQHAIVAHIATETAKLNALKAAAERTIALLTERRAALIAAAVTGKLGLGGHSSHKGNDYA